MAGWLDGWMAGWLDSWIAGWLDDLNDGWLVGWLDEKCSHNAHNSRAAIRSVQAELRLPPLHRLERAGSNRCRMFRQV